MRNTVRRPKMKPNILEKLLIHGKMKPSMKKMGKQQPTLKKVTQGFSKSCQCVMISYSNKESMPKKEPIGPISGVSGKNIALARFPPIPEMRYSTKRKVNQSIAVQLVGDTS